MPKFKGKNSITSAKHLLYQRHLYDTEAFPEDGGMGPPQIVDFNFAERNLYGKVDRQHNPVYAKTTFIVPVFSANNKNSTILAMDFVADQFNKFEAHYLRACRMGLIPVDDALLSTIEIKKAYESPRDLYRLYADEIMTTYYLNFLPPRTRQIKNFQDFLGNFLEFMEKMKAIFPITFSGYQRSSQSSIFTSGLALDIGGLDFGDDEVKEESFLTNPAFDFYINLAKQYGFSVNKHNPSVLVSDLAGPGAKVSLGIFGLTGVKSIFSSRYSKTLYDDLPDLTKLFMDYYNSFVTSYPLETIPQACGTRTITKVLRRQYVNATDHKTNNIILHLYINIRNIEERKPFNQIELNYFYNNALSLRKKSERMMLEYIDDQFKSKYNEKIGSLSYYKKKVEKKLDK